MTLKRSKPAPLATGTGSGILLSPTERSSGYPTFWTLSQEKLDAVTLIASRYRIAPETARAHVEAFGFGGRS